MITYYKPHISLASLAKGTVLVLDLPFYSKEAASRYVKEHKEKILERSGHERILKVEYRQYEIFEGTEDPSEDDFRLVSPAAKKENRQ